MILQSAQLLPDQKAAMEEMVGRKLQEGENIVFHKGAAIVENQTGRRSAAEQMRHTLWLLDPVERRMTIEDHAAALLEKATSENPA